MSTQPAVATFPAKRLTLDAILVALYVALSMLAIPLGGLKLTVEHLPIILCSVALGPVDAMIVGALGELTNQLLTYGITPTTILWMAPAMFRGLSMGLGAKLFPLFLGQDALFHKQRFFVFMFYCVLSGLVCSLINTGTLYLDSKMYGYYSYALVFGVFWIRMFASFVSSMIMAVAVKPVVWSLRKARAI